MQRQITYYKLYAAQSNKDTDLEVSQYNFLDFMYI